MGRLDPEHLVETIRDRQDMVAFLDALTRDAVEHGSEWENVTIPELLESVSAWLTDTTDREGDGQPALPAEHWQFVARLLLAGKHYE